MSFLPPRALLIGINDYATGPLRGCVNDALDVAEFLQKDRWKAKWIVEVVTNQEATKGRLQEKISAYLQGANEGSPTVIWFSGHGSTVDGRACLVPVDFERNGMLVREDLGFEQLTNLCSCTMVVDACHSATLAKVPTTWQPKSIACELFGRSPPAKLPEHADRLAYVSACELWQVAADASFAGRPNGALTRVMLDRLRTHPHWPLYQTINQVRIDLADKRFMQTPTISGQPYASLPTFAWAPE